MGIKLTTEVKEVIHQMIAITKEFEPGMMNTLVLFDALLLNRLLPLQWKYLRAVSWS